MIITLVRALKYIFYMGLSGKPRVMFRHAKKQ